MKTMKATRKEKLMTIRVRRIPIQRMKGSEDKAPVLATSEGLTFRIAISEPEKNLTKVEGQLLFSWCRRPCGRSHKPAPLEAELSVRRLHVICMSHTSSTNQDTPTQFP